MAANKGKEAGERLYYAKMHRGNADRAFDKGNIEEAIKLYRMEFSYIQENEENDYLLHLKIKAFELKKFKPNHSAANSFNEFIQEMSKSKVQVSVWQMPSIIQQAHDAYQAKDYKKSAALYAKFDWGKVDKDLTFEYQRENYDALIKTKQYLQVKQFAEKLIVIKGGEENNYIHYRYLADALTALGKTSVDEINANYTQAIELGRKVMRKYNQDIVSGRHSLAKIQALYLAKNDIQNLIVDCFNGQAEIYIQQGQAVKANECIAQAAKYSGERQLADDMKNKPAASVSPDLTDEAFLPEPPTLTAETPASVLFPLDMPKGNKNNNHISDCIDDELLDPWFKDEKNASSNSSKPLTVAESLVKSISSVLHPPVPTQSNIQETGQGQVFSSADADRTDGLTSTSHS